MHPGACKMKVLAWSYVQWSGIDKGIEVCSKLFSVPTKPQNIHNGLITPLGIPTEIIVSYSFGLYRTLWRENMFLLIVDAYLKWLNVYPMNTVKFQML